MKISAKGDSVESLDIVPISRYQLLDALTEMEKLLTNYKELYNEEYVSSLRGSCKDLHYMDFINKLTIRECSSSSVFTSRGFYLEFIYKLLTNHGLDKTLNSIHLYFSPVLGETLNCINSNTNSILIKTLN